MARYKSINPSAPGGLGILLTNLGTPAAPTKSAVRRYLAEFLHDPRVVELPRILWWPILHGIILRFRQARSAHAYQKIWTDNGSPLLVISQHQAAALRTTLSASISENFSVALGMRYGNPSIAGALEELRQANIKKLLVLPLYPQYSGATTGATFDAVMHELTKWRWVPELRFIGNYFNYPPYLDALSQQIRTTWQETKRPERLLFSFHGLPQKVIDSGDPYLSQCLISARGIADRLELNPDEWLVSFQSRLGQAEWIKPYTDQTLKDWATAGIKTVDVICPGFSADCLETLEEIALQNRNIFLQAGGENYRYLPALNARPEHIQVLTRLILQHIQGWSEI